MNQVNFTNDQFSDKSFVFGTDSQGFGHGAGG